MKKTYYLDLNTLLTYLRNKSGTLTTSFQLAGRSCTGSISLVQGQITSCVAEWSDGRRFEGSEAIEKLNASKEWQVHLDETLLSSSLMQSPQPQSISPTLTDAAYVPQPTSPLFLSLLTDYSTEQREILRTVHGLVDGYRTIAQIKAQSGLSSKTFSIAIDVLRKIGAIQ